MDLSKSVIGSAVSSHSMVRLSEYEPEIGPLSCQLIGPAWNSSAHLLNNISVKKNLPSEYIQWLFYYNVA